jgi:hypothetical protein
MLTISGTVKEIKREQVKAPKDGVHRASNTDGYLKGVRCFLLNGKLMPKGQTAFMHRYKKEWCLKVFFKVDNDKSFRQSKKAVMREWKKRKKLEPYGVIPRSPKIVKVRLDLKFKSQRIRDWAYAIKTQYVHYPRAAWNQYAKGNPYEWDCVNHKDHTPKGYMRFCGKLKSVCKKSGVGVCGEWPFKEKKNPKLGDIVWDTKTKQWLLVDCG